MKRVNRTLLVYIDHKFCGVATKIDYHHICFAYDPAYSTNDTPLSLSMPVTTTKKYKHVFKNWVLNLMPENPAILKDMARRANIAEDDLFAYLQAYGRDCAGAVRFLTQEESLAISNTHAEYVEVTEQEIGEILKKMLVNSNFSGLENGEHKSLAGMQQKLTLHQKDNKWYRVYGNIPSTHIIKPGVKEFENEPLVEYLTMKIFAGVGLNTAEVEYRLFNGQPAVIVKRYDRRQINHVWERIHQEDMCQAVGASPGDKYESLQDANSLNLTKIIQVVNSYSGINIQKNLDQLFKLCICNYLIGNTDNHAKNCAVILSGAETLLAPFYDAASVYGMEQENKYKTFGIYLGGCKELTHMTKDNLLNLYQSFNKKLEIADKEVAQIGEDLIKSIHTINNESKHIVDAQEACNKILVATQNNLNLLKKII